MKRILTRGAVSVLGLGIVFASMYSAHLVNAVTEKNPSQKDVDAAVLFDKHCDTCHGKDGQAKTFKAKFNHARNLTDAKWQSEVSDERLFNSISNGKGKMPAWGKKFSEAQINSLVAYVRSLKR
ncbi:MAG TPA: cytochrome c [Pyrinomonadaceae bacterium]|jgi:mono/diheme cytochrome c family protein